MNSKENFIFRFGFGGGIFSVGLVSLILIKGVKLYPFLFPTLSVLSGLILMVGLYFYFKK